MTQHTPKALGTLFIVLFTIGCAGCVSVNPMSDRVDEPLEGLVSEAALDPATKCAIGRFRNCNIQNAVARGLFETGLTPVFPENMTCRPIDEGFAISYTYKRNRENYHGGIDMPAPWGTPIIAAADGTVVGKFLGTNSFRGIEIVLRHGPDDTGLPFWIYTQYSHFYKMPAQKIGQRVRRGEVLGPTGNSGRGRKGGESLWRRPAIHFGAFYSTSDQYSVVHDRVIPVDGLWMDPIALFRRTPPIDSASLRALPETDKQVSISVMAETGEVIPADAKIIWPYTCAPQ